MEIRDFRPEDRQEYLDMSVDFYSGDASLFDVDMKKFEDTFELGVKGSPLMRGLTITEGDEIRLCTACILLELRSRRLYRSGRGTVL